MTILEQSKQAKWKTELRKKGSNYYSYRMNQTIKKRRKAMNHKYLNVDINIQKKKKNGGLIHPKPFFSPSSSTTFQ